jgi:hypothetical protein
MEALNCTAVNLNRFGAVRVFEHDIFCAKR